MTAFTIPGRRRRANGRPNYRLRSLWDASPLTYVTLIFSLVLSVFPIYWMIVVATRTNEVVGDVPPPVTPGGNFGTNVQRLFDNPDAYFAKGLVNSAIVASAVTISTVFFASLAGFAFAKLRFRGRNALLVLIVGTMMVPVQMGTIPLYMVMVHLHWTGKLQAVKVTG